MKTLQEYLDDAAVAHGHLCAGQVLGVRMAMLGLKKLGLEDPQGKDRKRIVTFVEIDRCATDAVMVVTGCRLGKRALKFRDWGKVAATFIDVETGKAVRVAAKESSKALAKSMHPEIENKNQQQMLAYREMPDEQLFQTQWVHVSQNQDTGISSRVLTAAHNGNTRGTCEAFPLSPIFFFSGSLQSADHRRGSTTQSASRNMGLPSGSRLDGWTPYSPSMQRFRGETLKLYPLRQQRVFAIKGSLKGPKARLFSVDLLPASPSTFAPRIARPRSCTPVPNTR